MGRCGRRRADGHLQPSDKTWRPVRRADQTAPTGSETRRVGDAGESQRHDKALSARSSRWPRYPGGPSPVEWFGRYFPRPAGNVIHSDGSPSQEVRGGPPSGPSHHWCGSRLRNPRRSSAFLAVKRLGTQFNARSGIHGSLESGLYKPARFRPATHVRISHAKLFYAAISAALARQEPGREAWPARSPRAVWQDRHRGEAYSAYPGAGARMTIRAYRWLAVTSAAGRYPHLTARN